LIETDFEDLKEDIWGEYNFGQYLDRFLDYLTTLFQRQKLCEVECDWKMFKNGQQVMILDGGDIDLLRGHCLRFRGKIRKHTKSIRRDLIGLKFETSTSRIQA
jgi:hypothetical protein